MKRICSAALALAMTMALSLTPAFAEEARPLLISSNPDVVPISATLSEEETEAPAYELTPRETELTRLSGTVSEITEEGFLLTRDESAGNQEEEIRVAVGEETLFATGKEGLRSSLADLKEGETVHVWAGPAMTLSLPPVAFANLVIRDMPENALDAPTYHEVHSVTTGEDGRVSLYVSGEMVLHLNEETAISPMGTRNIVTAADIVPGTRLLAWYSIVMMSYPGQTYPSQVVLLPEDYDGYVEADGMNLSLNGEALEAACKVVDGRLAVPMRAFAEALGCTVTWNAEDNSVTVTKDDAALYSFVIGGEEVTLDEETSLTTILPADAQDWVTYMALEDLAFLHNLKVSHGIVPFA